MSPVVTDASRYQATETLRDGRWLIIRAFAPEDAAGLGTAVDRTSAQTLYRRFFTVKRHFSKRETDFFFNVDFVDHVALVAEAEEAGKPTIVGAGRYVVVAPGRAEVAFMVIDAYQSQGIGKALLRHLIAIARAAELRELIAEVLPENGPMLKVFETSGLRVGTTRDAEVVHVTLALD
jgi:ribosomal protein S18 acetylase RimI-like enzyme